MKEPTQEQIKEFWEWCGLYKDLATDGERYWFIGEEIVSPVDEKGDPTIDLNNLFKWAVPKLAERLVWGKYVQLMEKWLNDVLFEGQDPALALFWGIYQVIKEEEA